MDQNGPTWIVYDHSGPNTTKADRMDQGGSNMMELIQIGPKLTELNQSSQNGPIYNQMDRIGQNETKVDKIDQIQPNWTEVGQIEVGVSNNISF